MGDFTGFTFGDWHSSDPTTGLKVLRVSGGDRYEEQLHPEIKDRTAEVPGRDGEYYFGSDYGPRTIDIEIAFDSLTEKQFRELRQVFGTRKIKELIFDERPYKKYMAKIESPIELSYICFDEPNRAPAANAINGVRRDRANDQEISTEVSITDSITIPADSSVGFSLTHIPSGEVTINPEVEYTYDEETYTYTFINDSEEQSLTIELAYSYNEISFEYAWEQVIPWEYKGGTQRIYKGEGKISFKCYFPFAKSVYEQIPIGEEESDWVISSGILTTEEYEENNIDKYDSENDIINIYNPGDIDTGFRLYLPAAVATEGVTLNYKPDGINTVASLVIDPIVLKTDQSNVQDVGVLIDTTNEIIAGVSQITMDSIITTSNNIYNEYVTAGRFFHFEPTLIGDGAILEVIGGATGVEIFYDYLYF